MFNTYTKNFQTKYLSMTWQQALQRKEIVRNNYRAIGDMKKAKEFVKMVSNFSFETNISRIGEKIIFSSESLIAPLLRFISPLRYNFILAV